MLISIWWLTGPAGLLPLGILTAVGFCALRLSRFSLTTCLTTFRIPSIAFGRRLAFTDGFSAIPIAVAIALTVTVALTIAITVARIGFPWDNAWSNGDIVKLSPSLMRLRGSR
jgi:hypothetical protein